MCCKPTTAVWGRFSISYKILSILASLKTTSVAFIVAVNVSLNCLSVEPSGFQTCVNYTIGLKENAKIIKYIIISNFY